MGGEGNRREASLEQVSHIDMLVAHEAQVVGGYLLNVLCQQSDMQLACANDLQVL